VLIAELLERVELDTPKRFGLSSAEKLERLGDALEALAAVIDSPVVSSRLRMAKRIVNPSW